MLSVVNALSPILRFTKSVDVVVITPHIDNVVDDGRGGNNKISGQIAPHCPPIAASRA